MTMATPISRSVLARSIVLARLRGFVHKGLAAAVVMLGVVCLPSPAHAASPIGLLVADFNHDGIPDILSPSAQANALTISFGVEPNGTFSPIAKNVPYPAGCTNVYANAVVIGDFNGDGYPDIAMSCYGGQLNGIYILLGNGDGTFTQGATVSGLSNLVVGDFNKDGKLDMVAEGANSSQLQTLIFYAGNGDGTFAAGVSSTLPAQTFVSPVAADLNGDGYPDIVLGSFTNSGVNAIYVFGNNQDGTFGVRNPTSGYSANAFADVGTSAAIGETSIIVGSFSAPNATDFVVVAPPPSAQLYLVRNTSSGSTFSFAATTSEALTGQIVSAVAAKSISRRGVGYADLLMFDGTNLSLRENRSTTVPSGFIFVNTFTALSVAANTSLYAAADANGDGHDDIYFATTTSSGTTLNVAIVSGSASAVSTAFSLPAGTNPVSATWPGNINFAGSTATGSQVVNAVGTVVALSSSKNPSFVGDSVMFTATITPFTSGTYVAGGTVTFADGATPLGTVALTANGTASVTTTMLAAATHAISATYSGDTVFAGSATTLSQVVNANTPVFTWATPAAITYGTALSGMQLNATAATTSGTSIPGTFVYMPAAGTVLNVGVQTISVLFTPTDNVTYTTASKSVQIVVNAATPTVTFVPAVGTITYGTPLGASQLNAVATGLGGATVPGTFVYTPAAGTVLGVGTQALGVVFTPSSTNYTTQSAGAQVTVTRATPTITWSTPSPIAYGVPLSATQLNAVATGAGGAALPGTFVYTPTAGTVLSPGSQTLSVVFTPTDSVDYTNATASVKFSVTDLVFTSFSPNTAVIGDASKTITITGSGFVTTTVAQLGTTTLATTLVNATTLTAIVPASNFLVAGTLQISVKSPATGTTSASLPLTVSAPTPSVTVTAPTTAAPGTQPAVTLSISNPYPLPLVATFTLTNAPSGTPAVDDPAVQFATGGRSYTFTIAAGSTTVPNIQIQTGTVAGTISVTLVLTANGVVVTPANVAQPSLIVVPAAVPSVTAASLTRSAGILTVTVAGFSNDREIVQANFHFVAAPGFSISTPDITAPVGAAFATWFANQQSLQYGSTFHYAQDFDVSDDASHIGSVVVTLTNRLGVSTSQTAQ